MIANEHSSQQPATALVRQALDLLSNCWLQARKQRLLQKQTGMLYIS